MTFDHYRVGDHYSVGDHYDVAIIGCGPVGATLANLLARQSRRVLVLDQSEQAYSLPRATHLDGEAVRILQSAGLGDMLASHLGIYARMRFEDADGALLIDWPRSTLPGPQGWRDSNRFHQPELEAWKTMTTRKDEACKSRIISASTDSIKSERFCGMRCLSACRL